MHLIRKIISIYEANGIWHLVNTENFASRMRSWQPSYNISKALHFCFFWQIVTAHHRLIKADLWCLIIWIKYLYFSKMWSINSVRVDFYVFICITHCVTYYTYLYRGKVLFSRMFFEIFLSYHHYPDSGIHLYFMDLSLKTLFMSSYIDLKDTVASFPFSLHLTFFLPPYSSL